MHKGVTFSLSTTVTQVLYRLTLNTAGYISDNAGPCSAAYACLTADPGVASLIQAWYYTFVEIDHEIIATVILLPPVD